MILRGSGANRRLRYLTHPLAIPASIPTPSDSPAAAGNHDNIYTNIALGNCIENLMQQKDRSSSSATINESDSTQNDLSQQLAANACHHKSIQNLIREERGGIPVPQPRAPVYKGSTEDLRCVSGRSSPAFSHSTPNSPPKHLIASGAGGGFHERMRAPSPLLQVVAATSTENRLIEHTSTLMSFVCGCFVVSFIYFFGQGFVCTCLSASSSHLFCRLARVCPKNQNALPSLLPCVPV